MFRVFLGSTFKDLHEHRKEVQAAVNRRDDRKADVMEEFGARAGRPKDVCLEVVGGCDVSVGLIGHCYGFVPDGEAVSITEAEYDAAVEKGLPRFLFVANQRFTPPEHIRETDEQYGKLQVFRARLQRDETCQWFDNDKGNLAARVGEALSREIERSGARPWPRSQPSKHAAEAAPSFPAAVVPQASDPARDERLRMRKENERLALENERLRLLRTAPAQLPTSAAQSAIAAPPNAETAEDRAAKHTLVMFVSEHLEPTCQALDALEEETVRSVIAGKDMQRIACYGLRCDPLYTKFWKAKERAYESVHNQTLVSLPLVEIITTIEHIRADYDTFRYRTLRMTNNNRLSSIEYPKWVDR